MVFGVAHYLDATAIAANLISLRDSIAGVVSTLRLNVGPKLADQSPHIRLVEDDYGIDVGERGDDLSALVCGHQGAPVALEPAHAGVGVHGNDELSTQCLGATKVPY